LTCSNLLHPSPVAHCHKLSPQSFKCAERSIPFTGSTSPPFILNGLPLR
jgi:hypothetical protein